MEKTMYKILFPVLLLALALSVSSQTNSLSQEEYLEIYIVALEKSGDSAYRKRVKEWYDRAGDVRREIEKIIETDSNGNSRSKRKETKGTSTVTYETISVGDKQYCCVDSEQWQEDMEPCAQHFNVSGYEGATKETYSREATTLDSIQTTVIRAYITTEIIGEGAKKSLVHFSENKVWISNDKRIVRREFRTGILPQNILSELQEVYEYPAGIKIEAPVP